MPWLKVLLCLCLFIGIISSQIVDPIVTIKNGTLRGTTLTLTSNASIDEFRGIPYAKSPVGDLRFKRPQPASAWTGVKNVSTDYVQCVQTASFKAPVTGKEDCLYLDVYRPNGAQATPLPVLVFIHGGGNNHGTKNKFNGTLLAEKGLIVVIMNYRLGPMGYLSNDDLFMPGNYGLMDQLLALHWVQENIAAFGGNPDLVTIMGESAGTIDVSFHILSPLSKGLFKRAIMMSGSAIKSKTVRPPLPQGTITPPTLAAAAGELLGCKQTGADLLSCLQSKDFKDFHTACITAQRNDVIALRTFAPRMENVFGFVPDYPIRMIARGAFNKVDVMSGFNAQEKGDITPIGDKNNDGLTIEEFRTLANKLVVDFFPYVNISVYAKLLEDIYIPPNTTDPFAIRTGAQNMKTDLTYDAPMILEAQSERKQSHSSKHFVYEFDYMPSNNRKPEWMGVLHAFNVDFVFGFPWKLLNNNNHNRHNASDEKVSDMMMTMWTNFVKVGDPTPHGNFSKPIIKWQQLYPKQLNYMWIGSHLEHRVYNSSHQSRVLDLYRATQREYLAAMAPVTLPVVG